MDNKSLFKNVSLLPNASAWVFDRTGLREKRRYFQFSNGIQPSIEPDDLRWINLMFPRHFRRYTRGSQEVAMSLTAGLDTRAIMATLQASDRSLPCYTFGGLSGRLFMFEQTQGRKTCKPTPRCDQN